MVFLQTRINFFLSALACQKWWRIRWRGFIAIAIASCCFCLAIAPTSLVAKSPDWIARSNQYANLLEAAIAAEDCQKKSENSALLILDRAFQQCRSENLLQAVKTLEKELNRAKNAYLSLDLQILLKVGRQELRSYALEEKYRVPYINLNQAILDSLKSTLKEYKSPSQQQAAILSKLKQYAGLEPGKIALTSLLEQAIEVQLQKSEIALPSKEWLKNDLNNSAAQIYAIQTFLRQQEVPDYKQAYGQLKKQLFDYEKFIRRQLLTRVEDHFRLPREMYVLELEKQGIEIPVEELIQQARTAFTQVQQQMQAIAPQIAQKKGLKKPYYRDVIQALKQERLSAKDTLRLYQNRAKDLEKIIQREQIVTLPKSEFKIRLATVREYQNFPVPLYQPDSNTFVIPVLQNPQKAKQYNDFTNPAMSWTLTVHEGRPGHDLQFSTIEKNQNLSEARTEFAANATSIEGWATYAEEIMQPYMPLEGQFMSLQFQLLRAARAFLEPELQLGRITTAEALKVLTQDAGFSQFFAEQEVKRYITRFPGQAPAYFYGYQQFLQLRSQAEKMLGKQFNSQKFHDFVLSQGFLTPKQLSQYLRQESGGADVLRNS